MRLGRMDGRQGWRPWPRKAVRGLPSPGMVLRIRNIPAVRLLLPARPPHWPDLAAFATVSGRPSPPAAIELHARRTPAVFLQALLGRMFRHRAVPAHVARRDGGDRQIGRASGREGAEFT